MKVIDILERVTTLYNDKDYDRVSERDYLRFLDDAINQLILSRPDANVIHSIVQLIPGTQQSIPDDGYTLIDIYMNKKAIINDDNTIGFLNYRPVYQVERKDLDYFDNWQAHFNAPGVDYINEFAFDLRSPDIFWVAPAVGSTPVYVAMDYSGGIEKYGDMIDIPLSTIEQMEIPIKEVFKGPIIDYFLYILYSTDSTSVVDREVSAAYQAAFYQALGLEYNASTVSSPKIENAEVSAAIREAS